MDIDTLLTADRVFLQLHATSKKQVLQELARHAAEALDVADREIFDVLLERERLGTTGVGNGIAIPHGKLPQMDKIFGLFARLDAPVSFDAIDDQPVDLVFLLLAPEDAGADHLKALSRVSRLLRDPETVAQLRDVKSRDELHALLIQTPTSKAA